MEKLDNVPKCSILGPPLFGSASGWNQRPHGSILTRGSILLLGFFVVPSAHLQLVFTVILLKREIQRRKHSLEIFLKIPNPNGNPEGEQICGGLNYHVTLHVKVLLM